MTPEQLQMVKQLQEETKFSEDVCRILLKYSNWNEHVAWQAIGRAIDQTNQDRKRHGLL